MSFFWRFYKEIEIGCTDQIPEDRWLSVEMIGDSGRRVWNWMSDDIRETHCGRWDGSEGTELQSANPRDFEFKYKSAESVQFYTVYMEY